MKGWLPGFVSFLLMWLAAMGAAAYQSKNAFKSFYEEGDNLFESQSYRQALEKYLEAYRLEPKARRYKEEGAFFRDYLPRYRIALCYEKLDLLAAEDWADKSREALEEGVIRRQKKVVAAYHRDLDRITQSASNHRREIKRRFDTRLMEAENHLASNRFEEARSAFEALSEIDPDRPEATVGLVKIGPARDIFIRSKILDAETAIIKRNLDEAAALVDQIAELDPRSSDIPSLRGRIQSAREALAQKEMRPPPTDGGEKVAVPPGKTNGDDSPLSNEAPPKRPDLKTDRNIGENRAERQKQLRKQALRTALLETLKPYRRGDPAAALTKLEEIEPATAADSSSYHWLKSLYLLGSHRHTLEPDPSLKTRARQELGLTLELAPDFEPDPDIYPRYVIEFVRATKRKP